MAAAVAPAAYRLVRSWPHRAAVTGDSMMPALRAGDWLLVDPDAYQTRQPLAGEVVVVPDPRDDRRLLVKRVESIDPDGRLRLAGDSPAASTDSRTFGPVDPEVVRGKAWGRYWPPTRVGRLR